MTARSPATTFALATLIAGAACSPSTPADRPTDTRPEPQAPAATISPVPSPVAVATGAPSVLFARADLTRGAATGVARADGALRLGTGMANGTYEDPYGYGAIAFESGTWTSEWTSVGFAFDEVIASWSVDTPPGSWIRVELQASGAGRTTKWYTMAIWASGDDDVHRTSIARQDDADGGVAFDTFVRAKPAAPLDAYRVQLTLHRKTGSTATPIVRMVAAMASASLAYEIPSVFSGAAVDRDVPRLSQEIHAGEFPQYDGGGEAWCSPASTAMLLAFWRAGPTPAELAAFPGAGYVDAQVDHAARYTYDWGYQGAGNWPDNTAYAGRYGLDAFVTRLRSLGEAQRFIDAGIPLVASLNGALPGFLFEKTNGHLLVIRGFTAGGDVIANDPAARSNTEVRKVYRRGDFEKVWLGGSAGVVYVIHPLSVPLPANVAGLPANW